MHGYINFCLVLLCYVHFNICVKYTHLKGPSRSSIWMIWWFCYWTHLDYCCAPCWRHFRPWLAGLKAEMARWKGLEGESCSGHGSQEAERGGARNESAPFQVTPQSPASSPRAPPSYQHVQPFIHWWIRPLMNTAPLCSNRLPKAPLPNTGDFGGTF